MSFAMCTSLHFPGPAFTICMVPSLALAYMQDNIFEWHFAVRGPQDTEFQVLVLSCLNLNALPEVLLSTRSCGVFDGCICRITFM